jgi:Superinfection immunity protein
MVLIVFLALYFGPAIVALSRDVPHKGSVVVVDVFLAWTVVGWVVALAMACRSVPPRPPVMQRPSARPPWAGTPPAVPPAPPPSQLPMGRHRREQ